MHDRPDSGHPAREPARPAAPALAPASATPTVAVRLLRGALVALLPLSAVLSVLALFVGLTFGFNLWRWDRAGVTVAWLILVLLPLAVYRAVRVRQLLSLPALAACVLILWAPPVALVVRPLLR